MGDPLWRECLNWLDRWKMIITRDNVNTIEELMATLRDGVVLCQLLHCVDPSCVDLNKVIYTSPDQLDAEAVSDFVCRNNIFLFLFAIINNFEMDHDLHYFDPTDLYQYKDISKVFRTLSALSHSPKFTASGIAGFPRKEKKLEKKLESEEQIYDDLSHYYNTVVFNESIHSPRKTEVPEDKDDIYDDIYQSICSPNKKSRLSIDISFSSKKSKRDYPLKEFIETESKYLTNLIMVRDMFKHKLTLLPSLVKEMVFFKLDDLISLHQDMLLSLQKGNNPGLVILQHKDRLRVYRNYCVNLSTAMAVLEKEELTNEKVKKELTKCQLRAKSPFPLSAHIVLPFQRLLKYHIMLAEIVKHTPSNHPDYQQLQEAHNFMKNFNTEVNEAKREQEEHEKQSNQDLKDLAILENVERTVKSMKLPFGSRLSDFGRLRRAGDLRVYQGELVTDYVFLMDQVMVMCNKPSLMQQRFRFKSALKLKEFKLESNRSEQNTIRLFHRTVPSYQPTILLARSAVELELWLRALLTCLDLIYPSENINHSLQINYLGENDRCSSCNSRFLGIIRQGYSCQLCGASLHKPCIANLSCSGDEITLRRSSSIALPTMTDRSSLGSTMSLVMSKSEFVSGQVKELQEGWELEQEQLPLNQQDWFAGHMDLRTATEKIKNLPTGTFLVRLRLNKGDEQEFALDLKTGSGVKHMKICVSEDQEGNSRFSFSPAREFNSLVQLINFYRSQDLLENFSYKDLEGVKLNMPYKSA